MFPEFYGNSSVLTTLRRMLERGRASHGMLFYGETGSGRKTLADRFAAEMLCTGDKKPCGICKSCRMLLKHIHPDVVYPERSGKKGGFSADTVRRVCLDLAIPPNEGNAKFYIFTDCDAMEARTQNILLKAIEEPPDYAYFLFTAAAPAALLPTVRSRIVSLALSPVSETQCRNALSARGFSPEECDSAVSVFHGNIGQCLAYFQQENIREIVALTKNAIHSIIKKDEYTLLQTTAKLGKDRERILLFLEFTDRIVRDAMVRKYKPDAPCIGCDPDGAALLAKRLPTVCGYAIHAAAADARGAIQANVNPSLTISAFCASCMDADSKSIYA